MRTHHQVINTFQVKLRASLQARCYLVSALEQEESEGVVLEKCRGVSTLLPTCTSLDAANFFSTQ